LQQSVEQSRWAVLVRKAAASNQIAIQAKADNSVTRGST